jgi:catechol 2,3-dioxygenase-like lactoylglutathione lyase family enzyme
VAIVIRTHGLTHIALAVRDVERSLRFYADVLGARVVYREPGQVQVQTPGSLDVIALEEGDRAGDMGGVAHFGFRLVDPADLGSAKEAIEKAGGRILETGEFVPGEPYLFATDPDGYVIEVWYE